MINSPDVLKSKFRKVNYILIIYNLILISPLVWGMYIDLNQKMPIILKLVFLFIGIAFPLLCIVALMSFPKLIISGDIITMKNSFKSITLKFANMQKVDLVGLNKIYKLGSFFRLTCGNGRTIDIPTHFYKNESDLFSSIEKAINSNTPLNIRLDYIK